MSKKYIDRYTTAERVLHWIVTISFFTLLLSGLGLYSRLFTGYFNLFGNGHFAIVVHKYTGILFFFSSIGFFLHNRKSLTEFDKDDLEWVRHAGGYLSREDAHLQVGKLNAGQKMFGLFIAAATLILGITGIFIWWPIAFPRWIVQLSLMLHRLMFVGSMMFAVVHVYLGSMGNPGTVQAMLWGKVTSTWAKHHHPKWYKEVTEEEG